MHHWFREQMAMYTAYHRDSRNRATHFIGVPLIVFALLLALSLVKLALIGPIPVTFASLLLMGLLILYVLAVPVVGFVSAAVLIPLLWTADRLAQSEVSDVWLVTGVCFIGGWIIQFMGHVFEGRRPALFDNLLQVFMAPGFLIAESLFAIGLLADLKRDLEQRSVKYNATAV
jgi:uncharacterized membrane protein YGL010W